MTQTSDLNHGAAELADHIFRVHACTDIAGKHLVDPESVAPMPGESAPDAALRLLKLAHKRGAFNQTVSP